MNTCKSKQEIKMKIPLTVIASRGEAEQLLHELALKDNRRRALVARLNAAVLKLQEDAAKEISACEQGVSAAFAALQAWAAGHPEEFPRGRKSVALLGGTLGYRTGTPRLALASRALTWDAIVERLRQKGWTGFIRTRSEPDKDSLLAQRDRYNLLEVGLKVVQDEAFYVEPRLTVATAKTARAN
jgi:phage host-nuclease inhibitor protein Gam